jgi:hypothetical protein
VKNKTKSGNTKPLATPQVLTGWPNIAKYLGQPLAVAQRWARDGMPVKRSGRYMTASPEELSQWLGQVSGTEEGVHIAQVSDEDLLGELRGSVKQARIANASGVKRSPARTSH